MKNVLSISLDGTRVPAIERERWILSDAERHSLYEQARRRGVGLVVLATCYRFELYTDAGTARALLGWLRALRPQADTTHFAERSGEKALMRLLRVAAGLESAVLGEVQVLGQIRRARSEAEQARALSPVLRTAFAEAVSTGRAIRQNTGLGLGVASAASAALLLAHNAPGGLSGRHVVVIGGGEMGRLLLKLLAAARPSRLTLVSAHLNPQHPRITVQPPEALAHVLPDADVIFTATRRTVLDTDAMIDLQDRRGGRPLTIVDLGMPRNVALAAGEVPGVRLCDVDALGDVVDANLRRRQAAVPDAEAFVAEGYARLQAALQRVQQEALIGDLRRKAETIRRDTLVYVCDRCRRRTCEPVASDQEAVCTNTEFLTRTLTNRLLHDLTHALRYDGEGLDPAALRVLFRLDPHAS